MSKETDKELSVLYLARSEGKTIQRKDAVFKWFNVPDTFDLHHQDRIRPQTAEEAAKEYAKKEKCLSADVLNAHIAGVKWGRENPKDQE